MINRGRCITLVLLDTLSTKHDHCWIRTLYMPVCLWDWCRWHESSNFQHISITLNWLVILITSLNPKTYVLFFNKN